MKNVPLVLLLAVIAVPGAGAADAERPNIVIIFADDLGYGDLSCYGHPTIRTPHLDRMAGEGMRFTQFYSAAPICTPSRAALLTGRLPIRNGMCGGRGVLFPDSTGGIAEEEITLAEVLKERGYATGCVGKWHLGHLPQYLPTRNGFDSYYGIPYSNDMKPCPLLENERTVEEPADQTTLTRRYTEQAVKFIRDHRDGPFFLYMPHTFPHVPLFASKESAGRSERGLYGDVVEELDDSVGAVLDTIRNLNIADRTFVFFTSDNGPWLIKDAHGGSAGLLKEGKGSTWEGGMREPAIAWWPGKIPAGVITTELGATMDLFTTAVLLAGGEVPSDRVIDGVDLRGVLFTPPGTVGARMVRRDVMQFYRGAELWAFRKGPWKIHFKTRPGYRGEEAAHDPPLLFNLEVDPSEKYDVAKKHPDVLADLVRAAGAHRASFQPPPTRVD